ncbi:hypothetical protein [Bradyrhizobium sp. sBnM-33]|uniref:hypothetical protein n=1 Tax=Bradyrhizobium sp. sBnM-33 TaxID=2831780 RepID=UPI001BD1B466|nr:hypothetical protein [Bradyrhizobium sp. sBnM-33]WOH53800.1 hypothetical protein RX328_17935 [Bradyrhizobium sp. sBnM-33]
MINTRGMKERDTASPPSRFLVRQGAIYDRQRRAPAMIGTRLAVDLTKEQANRIERMLMVEQEGNRSS